MKESATMELLKEIEHHGGVIMSHATLLAAVRQEIYDLLTETTWVPATERLPESKDHGDYFGSDTVLVDWQYRNCENGQRDICKAGLVNNIMWVNVENGEQIDFDNPDAPTHWRVLPSLPGVQK